LQLLGEHSVAPHATESNSKFEYRNPKQIPSTKSQ
jgi:hypothetical protein